MNNSKTNASGCKDPTMHSAMTLVSKEEKADKRAGEFIKFVKMISKAYDVELIERVKFRDKITNKKYQ